MNRGTQALRTQELRNPGTQELKNCTKRPTELNRLSRSDNFVGHDLELAQFRGAE